MSAYEKMRLENMARNQAMMRQLGLVSTVPTTPETAKKPEPSELPAPVLKKRKDPEEAPVVLRRSSRKKLEVESSPEIKEKPLPRLREKKQPSVSPKRPASLTSKYADANLLVFRELLGSPVPIVDNKPKSSVLALAHPTATWNKMSGILEWRNCVMLFVTVGLGRYSNLFLENDSQIVWFAQPSQNTESSAIQRLRDPKETVLLFCRRESHDAFISCGTLRLFTIDTEVHPLKLTFTLLDAPTLAASPAFGALRKDPESDSDESKDTAAAASPPHTSEDVSVEEVDEVIVVSDGDSGAVAEQ